MEGFFSNPKGQFGTKDTKGVFSFSPQENQTRRSWIKYADGVYEPVRKGGNLARKKDDHRQFQWWQVNKPADWKPKDEGADFSWNHTLGSKDDLADQDTGRPLGGQSKADKTKVHARELGKQQDVTEPHPDRTGRTLLTLGSQADNGEVPEKETVEERPASKAKSEPKQAEPKPRNPAQDAAELNRGEKRNISAEEHARDMERLASEKEAKEAAATAGALGGMVQSKGQGKAGKASGQDGLINQYKDRYKNAKDPKKKAEIKQDMKKDVDDLREQAKKLKGKARNKLLKRASQIEGAMKILTDGKVRSGFPFVLFNVDQARRVLEGIPLDAPDEI